MMTDALEISIISAPLAAIDRRVLSQAWYSALHVARASSAERPLSRKAGQSARPSQKYAAHAHRGRFAGDGSIPRSRNPLKAKSDLVSAVVSERRSGSPLARKIERAFFTPKAQRQRATLTVGDRRVHVTIASGPSGTRFLAVCSPAIREVVARALAQARFALAARCLPCS